jgi:chromosome segregation ATPase
MDKYIYAIVTGVVALVICAIAIWIMTLKHKKEQQQWEKIAEDNYTKGKEESADIIRETCDRIEEDKEKLAQLSDRELLVEIMLALGTYARRIDRMDAKLQCITNYKAYIDDMNMLTQKLTGSFVVLDDSITNATSTITALKKTAQETSDGIHKLISDLSSLRDLHNVLSSHVANLSQQERDVTVLQNRVARVVEEMNAVMTTNDQAPMKKLKLIETEVVSIKDAISEVSEVTDSIKKMINDSLDEYNDDGLWYKVKEIEHKTNEVFCEVDGVSSKISDVASKADEIFYEVDGTKSKLRDIERLGRVADDIEGIKDKVDNALDKWGYDSLYRKFDELSGQR